MQYNACNFDFDTHNLLSRFDKLIHIEKCIKPVYDMPCIFQPSR